MKHSYALGHLHFCLFGFKTDLSLSLPFFGFKTDLSLGLACEAFDPAGQ